MSVPLRLFAAGSLRPAFTPLCRAFTAQSGIAVSAEFGPAGLLRERIERGEACGLFASANVAHPQALLSAGLAAGTRTFAFNRLNLTLRRAACGEGADWLALLTDASLRIGTSTPGCDPSGDYTLQLFDNIERRHPGVGRAIAARAVPLVGGRDTVTIPQGELASAWLLREGLTDLFIGYAHYATLLRGEDGCRIVAIPEPFSPRCEYRLAWLDDAPQTAALVDYILSARGRLFLQQAGLSAPEGE
ncbi:molybdate ABC transporter substrate-binding protein [Pluralibacter gergoviae]|uniref:substrate-binding domain-containing protein n=1 Tax=Pluralibacter gergoviae TaxID=61647 RepID=UPI000651011D|nr:substrate-binding domain-containing protein [Pluralibacter gergoviae]KMK19419.1 molybdate ABC transporter substrate-binding protein [Pluralibacter gergoviae]